MAEYYKCDDCGYESDNILDIVACKDFFQRVVPGDQIIVPIGDCPKCGAFCFVHERYYNHMFTLAFTVVSKNDGKHVTTDEYWQGLKRRMRILARNNDELESAAQGDLPCDTYPTGHEEFLQWQQKCKAKNYE